MYGPQSLVKKRCNSFEHFITLPFNIEGITRVIVYFYRLRAPLVNMNNAMRDFGKCAVMRNNGNRFPCVNTGIL